MTPSEFINKWQNVSLKEISASQSHFNDICSLVGHSNPVKADPKGEFFTFEETTDKADGKTGRADVWFKGKFIWEYKGFHKNLNKAYDQLLLYREFLGNPPLLITSDMHEIIIHTNFTNTVKEIYKINFDDIKQGNGLELLKRVFFDPNSFKPNITQEQATKATAESFLAITNILEKWAEVDKEHYDPEKVAHFISKLLFSLFVEDMGLLPDKFLQNLSGDKSMKMDEFSFVLKDLFKIMKEGGSFGTYHIRRFNGSLFDDDFIPKLNTTDLKDKLLIAASQDWSGIDPAIFGTLFERVIDKSKRSQLGLHYTSKDDIELVVEPVVIKPLQEKWFSLKNDLIKLILNKEIVEANKLLKNFSEDISNIKILDPACGSGNFLYIVLQKLLSLQKDVIVFATKNELEKPELTVNPNQLYGIEKDLYAFELAQITIWIGYIQWRFENGFSDFEDPILKPLHNIEHKDSILAENKESIPIEPSWPEVDFIIGNPPFLGSRKMRPELGDKYCNDLLLIYKDRIDGLPDLVCYWFEKARKALNEGKVKRVGLLATQAIRGGSNRKVLEKISNEAKIFMAWSDKEWILDGASVHVSIIGFDKSNEEKIYLNGEAVEQINSDLTSNIDLTQVKQLSENSNISFQGVVLRGKFNISKELAGLMLSSKNSSKLNNSAVIRKRLTGKDISQRLDESYVIDFGLDMNLEQAIKYKEPFNYVKEYVFPERQKAKQDDAKERWWIHWNPRPEMRKALSKLNRYIATSRVGKHRIFVWLDGSILPDCALVVFARSDDYFFGVLHSKVHELWARNKGTQLRDVESGFRYTSKTTFETFPLPWTPGKEPKNEIFEEISEASKLLNKFRNSWLYPPKEEIDITISRATLNKRTLTNLYNVLEIYRSEYKNKDFTQGKWNKVVKNMISLEEIKELDYIHDRLDNSVLNAYGLPSSIDNEQILSHLLKLNLERKGKRELLPE